MKDLRDMTLDELLEITGETLAEALERSVSLADLAPVSLEVAFDTESVFTQMKHDAAVGKLIRERLQRYLFRRVEDMDEPEQRFGNPAYDLVAKDRLTRY